MLEGSTKKDEAAAAVVGTVGLVGVCVADGGALVVLLAAAVGEIAAVGLGDEKLPEKDPLPARSTSWG